MKKNIALPKKSIQFKHALVSEEKLAFFGLTNTLDDTPIETIHALLRNALVRVSHYTRKQQWSVAKKDLVLLDLLVTTHPQWQLKDILTNISDAKRCIKHQQTFISRNYQLDDQTTAACNQLTDNLYLLSEVASNNSLLDHSQDTIETALYDGLYELNYFLKKDQWDDVISLHDTLNGVIKLAQEQWDIPDIATEVKSVSLFINAIRYYLDAIKAGNLDHAIDNIQKSTARTLNVRYQKVLTLLQGLAPYTAQIQGIYHDIENHSWASAKESVDQLMASICPYQKEVAIDDMRTRWNLHNQLLDFTMATFHFVHLGHWINQMYYHGINAVKNGCTPLAIACREAMDFDPITEQQQMYRYNSFRYEAHGFSTDIFAPQKEVLSRLITNGLGKSNITVPEEAKSSQDALSLLDKEELPDVADLKDSASDKNIYHGLLLMISSNPTPTSADYALITSELLPSYLAQLVNISQLALPFPVQDLGKLRPLAGIEQIPAYFKAYLEYQQNITNYQCHKIAVSIHDELMAKLLQTHSHQQIKQDIQYISEKIMQLNRASKAIFAQYASNISIQQKYVNVYQISRFIFTTMKAIIAQLNVAENR